MVCAACILGLGVGLGGIFLYRVLKRWLQQSSKTPSLGANVEHACNNGNTEAIAGKQMVRNVTSLFAISACIFRLIFAYSKYLDDVIFCHLNVPKLAYSTQRCDKRKLQLFAHICRMNDKLISVKSTLMLSEGTLGIQLLQSWGSALRTRLTWSNF